jgi:hypothetical protein
MAGDMMKDQIKVQLKDARTGAVLIEQRVGEDLFRRTGKWNYLERYIDHANPDDPQSYREIIWDGETREIIRYCVEPLRKHQRPCLGMIVRFK